MPGSAKDMTGKKFGKLLVIERAGTIDVYATWHCICDCGNKTISRGHTLRDGRTKSCGCLARETSAELHKTHGLSKSGEYKSWLKMRERCLNPNHHQYGDYGGRGIDICERWNNFELFLQDMGRRPTAKHTLDRIKNDQGYFPENCRWATRTQQNRNTRVSKPIVRCDGLEFLSVGAGAEAVNGSCSSVRRACITGKSYRGFKWAYKLDMIDTMLGVAPGETQKNAEQVL